MSLLYKDISLLDLHKQPSIFKLQSSYIHVYKSYIIWLYICVSIYVKVDCLSGLGTLCCLCESRSFVSAIKAVINQSCDVLQVISPYITTCIYYMYIFHTLTCTCDTRPVTRREGYTPDLWPRGHDLHRPWHTGVQSNMLFCHICRQTLVNFHQFRGWISPFAGNMCITNDFCYIRNYRR